MPKRDFACLKRMEDGRQTILLQEDEALWRFCRGHVEDVALATALTPVRPVKARSERQSVSS